MVNVPKRFANHGDDWRSIDREFSCGLNVQRESSSRPTENRFADRTPFLLRRYFTDNNARFVSGRILKRKV